MNREPKPKDLKYKTKEASPASFNDTAQDGYSGHLRDLVARCVEFVPQRRPSLRELKRKILHHTDPGNPDNHADGMRDKSAGQAEEDWDSLLKYPDEIEAYSIGFSVPTG